jgi:hypothetical protein
LFFAQAQLFSRETQQADITVLIFSHSPATNADKVIVFSL